MTNPIQTDLQSLQPSALIELFVLDATVLGGTPVYFHAGTNGLQQPIVWQGQTYQPYPIQVNGFELTGQGALPKPTMSVSNVGGLISALVMEYDDLVGAKLIRKRTFAQYLDAANSAGSTLTFSTTPLAGAVVSADYADGTSANLGIGDGISSIFYSQSQVPAAVWITDWQGKTQRYSTPRTNLLLQSTNLASSTWASARIASVVAATGPDGSSNASTITSNSSGTAYKYQTMSVIAGNQYELSVYAEAGSTNISSIQSFTQPGYCQFTLSGSGSAGSPSGSLSNSQIRYLGGGWYRCSVIFTATATGSNNVSSIEVPAANASITFFGPQFVALSSGMAAPTSFIPTTASASTVSDFSSTAGANPTANGSAGFDDVVWWVHQKTAENKQVVTFQLASILDVTGCKLPGRQILANCCSWQYRTWNGTAFDYSNATCPYTGSAMFDASGNPVTSGAQDKCSQQLLNGCAKRYPTGTVPFGGFPAARRFS